MENTTLARGVCLIAAVHSWEARVAFGIAPVAIEVVAVVLEFVRVA
jgi:hypothetical protein